MCGIAGIHRRTNRPVPKLGRLADELLLSIEHRGRHATGYLALMEDGRVQLEKKTITASRFVGRRGLMRADAKTVLLHTRFKTVGAQRDPRNAHPVASGHVAAVHNGTIYNANEIFQTFGLPRIGTVDSEIIPALIDHLGWERIDKSLGMLVGGAATAIVHTEHADEVVLARLRSYPLCYAVTKDVVIWASTPEALREAWFHTYGKRLRAAIHEMKEGEVARINGKVETGRVKLAPIYQRPVRFPICPAPMPKGKGKRGSSKRKRAGVPPVQAALDLGAFQVAGEYTAREAILDLMSQGLSAGESRTLLREALNSGEDIRALTAWAE